jgi:GNAT superfamily N-acetyltransferase
VLAENGWRRLGVVRLASGMRIERLDVGDLAAVRACHEVLRAALAWDDPYGPPFSLRFLRALLEHPAEPFEAWYVPGETAGKVAGWYVLTLPAPENRDRAELTVEVRPSSRRRGIGSALLRHAAQRAAADGRSILTSEALTDTAGEPFALCAGALHGLLDARRVLVLGRIPAGRIASLRESAARAAAGYSLVSWYGRTPDEYLNGHAGIENAMNDRPLDAGEQARVWDAKRVREQINDVRERQGRNTYTMAALHDATSEMAALTEVGINQENPEWGHQLATAVTRPHRGHRLGLLVKTAMLDWLAEAEPSLARIVTGNAAVNQHMIAINEALGYVLLDPQWRHYELAVAGTLGTG